MNLDRRAWLMCLDRLQVLAGRFGHAPLSALAFEMNRIVAELSPSLSQREHVVVANVMANQLARLVRLASLDDRPEVLLGFLNLSDTCGAMDHWRPRWLRLTACCVALLQSDDTLPARSGDARVTQILDDLQSRSADPSLTLSDLARLVHLSPSHAVRLLKRHTGSGFLAHLHRRRVTAARRLLIETALSVKEVAASVGYAHPSQLSRQFKRAYGNTPRTFRAALTNAPRST
jgi:AraC-like DNA-binding protein